jgi:anti-sigma B factor antagonist
MSTDRPDDGSAGFDDADDVGDIGEVVRFDVLEYGDKAAVLHVVGEIDTLTAPLLRAQLEDQVTTHPLLVLDLTDVTFLGSAGLAVLVAAKDDAELREHRLRIVPGSRIVVRALQATGLLTIFDVVDSVREGLGDAG